MNPFARRTLAKTLAAALVVAVASAPLAAEVERYAGGPIVAELVTRLLEQTHYEHKKIDAKVSKEFLRNYLDSYDYNHMILLKSDVDEFETKYQDSLGQLAKDGDVDPAYEIYDRVLERLNQRVSLVKALASSTYTFTDAESVSTDRHEAPWPADEKAADDLWRRRIENEILTETIARKEAAEKREKDKAKEAVAKSTAAAKDDEGVTHVKEPSIQEVVDKRYDRLLESYKEYDGTDIVQDYLTSLTHVYDPHTDYLAAAQKENFDISMKLSLVGIGAVLRSEDGYAKIVSLVPGGPADQGKKLKPNDKVEAVAQGDGPFVEIVGMKLDRVVEMIRGKKGTTVRLRVIPAKDSTARVVIPIVRDQVKLTDQEAKARVYDLPGKDGRAGPKIGVLNLPSFYADMRGGDGAKSLTRDTERLIDELKRRAVDAIVVDLRQDGGGSLAEAVSLTGLFIKDGPVVQVKDSRGTIRVLKDTDPSVDYSDPLVVLTSRESASAAEIFTAAMQDYGRGVIVGDKTTFGKGTVQSILELNQYLPPAYRAYRPGALKLTVQKFYRVSGGSTQNRGVIPDIHLPSAGDISDMTESAQKDALPYDEIEPADYVRVGAVDGKIPGLKAASDRRVADSQEFKWIREDLKRWEKQKEEKRVSLNMKTRLSEREADEKRVEDRRAERKRLHEKDLPYQEITLSMLDGKTPAASVAASTAAAKGGDAADDEDGDAPDAILNETLRIAAQLAQTTTPAPVASAAGGGTVAQ